MPSSIHHFLRAAIIVTAFTSAQSAHAQKNRISQIQTEVDALAAEVKNLSAQTATSATAIERLSAQVTDLVHQLDTLAQNHRSQPDLIRAIDDLTQRIHAIEPQIAQLFTQLADIEQPAVA